MLVPPRSVRWRPAAVVVSWALLVVFASACAAGSRAKADASATTVAASSGRTASGTVTERAASNGLPRLWAVQVRPGVGGWFDRAVLRRVRRQGVDALTLRVSTLERNASGTRAFESVLRFAAAEELYLIAVLPAGKAGTPAVRHAVAACAGHRFPFLRCAVEAGSLTTAAKLARTNSSVNQLVAVYVTGPGRFRDVARLARVPRRRILAIAPLYESFKASVWAAAIGRIGASASVNLGVAPGSKASPSVQQFAALLAGGGSTAAPPSTDTQVVAGWDIGWRLAAKNPWSDITQDYLFALQTTNGSALDTSFLKGVNVHAWVKAAHAHNVLAFITIGGIDDQNWENACSDTNRRTFVSNLVSYMNNNGFDGVDLDIEDNYWSKLTPPVSAMNTCIQAIADAAHATITTGGKRAIVTEDVTTPWMGSWLKEDVPYIDQFNLMTYTSTVDQQNSDVQATHSQGIPYAKMVIGVDLIDNGEPSGGCGQFQSYAKATGLAGVIVWDIREDAARSGGDLPCFDGLRAAG